MIRITFKNASDIKVPASLQKKKEALVAEVNELKTRLMYELLERVKAKLSGEVLQTRRGAGGLLGSVEVEEVENVGDKIIGKITAGAGLGIYPNVQEYGGTRQYEIYPRNKKALAFFPSKSSASTFGGSVVRRITQGQRSDLLGGGATFRGLPAKDGPMYKLGKSVYFKTGKRKGSLRPAKFGEFTRLGGIVVKHVSHPPLPERSYMRSTLAEMQPMMVEQIRETIARSLR